MREKQVFTREEIQEAIDSAVHIAQGDIGIVRMAETTERTFTAKQMADNMNCIKHIFEVDLGRLLDGLPPTKQLNLNARRAK